MSPSRLFGVFSWRLYGLIGLVVLSLSGCGAVVNSTIGIANQASQKNDDRKFNRLLAEHLQSIKALQAKGDPLGDYLWVKANEDGAVENAVTDRKELKKMYQAAADKGSVDAQIMVGLMSFVEGAPRHFNYGRTEEEIAIKRPIWEEGLKKIQLATKEQCWYYTPVISPRQNKLCLTPVAAYTNVWWVFRDGYTFPKDQALSNGLKAKKEACERSKQFVETKENCQSILD